MSEENGIYLLLVYLVTALVPSETACFANSPGKRSLTAVWISLDEMVFFLFCKERREASDAIRSKISLTKEFMMLMALLETPTSG